MTIPKAPPRGWNKGHSSPPPAPIQHDLPDEHESITRHFELGGFDFYVTVGLYEDGRPGELFLVVGKEGSTMSGLHDSWAKLVSRALQTGTPVETIIRKYQNTRFEPSGWVKDFGNVTSIYDLISRWLDQRFCHEKAKGSLG
jgi:ribonucleoside-diphosphate reductase alpha chain